MTFPQRLVEEGGIEILLTLLLSGTGNLENNPRPVKESSVKMRQLGLEVSLHDFELLSQLVLSGVVSTLPAKQGGTRVAGGD